MRILFLTVVVGLSSFLFSCGGEETYKPSDVHGIWRFVNYFEITEDSCQDGVGTNLGDSEEEVYVKVEAAGDNLVKIFFCCDFDTGQPMDFYDCDPTCEKKNQIGIFELKNNEIVWEDVDESIDLVDGYSCTSNNNLKSVIKLTSKVEADISTTVKFKTDGSDCNDPEVLSYLDETGGVSYKDCSYSWQTVSKMRRFD
jgi:hypothetical protein